MTVPSTHQSDRLSTFRTAHEFSHYADFESVEQYLEMRAWARKNNLPVYILGNGSNTLFRRKRIETVVLRNSLPREMTDLGDGRLRVSSATKLMKILRHCERNGLGSFYFLASVPATVGGAIAMNAGMAHETIFDFVESVTFVEGDELVTLKNDEIEREHRRTRFTGVQDCLIVDVVFRFPPADVREKEIKKRIDWAKEFQDLGHPNCGSIFRKCHYPLMNRMRRFPPFGLSIPFFHARWSRLTNNWIINHNPSSRAIVFLIKFTKLVHRLIGKRAETEVIEVD